MWWDSRGWSRPISHGLMSANRIRQKIEHVILA